MTTKTFLESSTPIWLKLAEIGPLGLRLDDRH